MRLYLLTFFLIFTCIITAQPQIDFGRVDDDLAAKRLTISDTALTEYIHQDIPQEFKDQLTDRKAFQFADQTARGSINWLESGKVYNGWTKMDDYVNKILQSVLPADLNNKKFVRAYVLKDETPNAFMTPSGLFFINVGMMAELESENTLASVIAHELAHYQLRHGLDRFVKSSNKEFGSSTSFRSDKMKSQFSIKNELAADDLAAEYLQAAGYEVFGLVEAFKVFKRQDDKQLLKQKDIWEVTETTHPSSARRIERIEKLTSEKEAQGEGRTGLSESSAVFQQLRQEARVEVLKYALANFNYQYCLEKAFTFHVFEPNDPTYVYYAMEAIRRRCYLDVTHWGKKFIVDSYYDIVEEGGTKRKVEIKGHFFDQFRPGMLAVDPSDYEQVSAKFYWEDEVKFITNEQAFQFFYQVGKFLKAPECTLSNALSLSFKPEQQDEYLRDYLAYGEVRYRAFAEALLNGKLYEQLPTRKLTVFNRFLPVMRHGVDKIIVWHKGDDQPLIDALDKAISATPDRDFLYLPNLKKTKINDYLTFAELERFSFFPLVARGEKTELHVLDPVYWEVMKRFGVNRIEFVNCVYHDRAKGAFTLEVYQEIVGSSFHDILGKAEEKGRFVEVFLSGLQILPDGPMKIRSYEGSKKLAAKGLGYGLLGALLTERLEELDESLED